MSNLQKSPPKAIWPTLIALGLTSTISQLVLMREMVAIFYGNELLYGLVLTVWLAWVAVGSWGLGQLATRQRLGTRALALGLGLCGILLPAEVALLRNIRFILDVTPGAFVEFGSMFWTIVLTLAPLCLLGGFLFTLGARITLDSGGSAGQAYVWESIGAVVGGALFSFLLIRLIDPFQTALIITGLNLTVSLWFLTPRVSSRFRILASFAIFSLLLVIVALSWGHNIHEATLKRQWDNLIFAADSPYGRLTIQARDGQRAFFVNGLLAFETQGTFPEEVIHLPLLMHPNPQHVLLIGGGIAGDLREILKHPVQGVTYVEIDPMMIEAAQTYLPSEDAAVLFDPRVTLALSDGRLFVKEAQRLTDDKRASFDVIILDLPEPSTGALNRFYSLEFFDEVQDLLSPGGVFSLGLPSAENYWSPELLRRNGSIFQTLQEVFPEIVVLPGEHNFFLASLSPLEGDPAVLAKRLTDRQIKTAFITSTYIEYLFTTDRFAAVREDLESATGVKLNRDLIPICYYYDLALWLSRFYPSLHGFFESIRLIRFGYIILPLALIVTLARWRGKQSFPLAIAGIGLIQMGLEVVLLLGFQVLHGSLYNEVSLIVTAFMAGLALGSHWANRWLLRKNPTNRKVKIVLTVVIMVLVLYCGSLPLLLNLSLPIPVFIFPLLALVAGSLGGSTFPLAVTFASEKTGRGVGMLYGADLVGGCLGALLCAVFFVPLLGIPQTCIIMALIGIAGVVVMI